MRHITKEKIPTRLSVSRLRAEILEETNNMRGCEICSRFKSRFEAAVHRMARLGRIEEVGELNQEIVDEMAKMKLSLADDTARGEKALASMAQLIESQPEKKSGRAD